MIKPMCLCFHRERRKENFFDTYRIISKQDIKERLKQKKPNFQEYKAF